MKRYVISLTALLLICICFNNLFSQEINIEKKVIAKDESSSSILFKPFFDVVVGIKSGYFFYQDKYSRYIENSFPLTLYMQYNPFLINNFYTEIEASYLRSSIKYDDNGSYQWLLGSINLIYQYPLNWFNPYAIAGGGGLYRVFKSDFMPESQKSYIENVIQAGFGARFDLDYNYLLDLRSTYKISFGNNIKKNGIDITLGLGYAFNSGPEYRLEKHISIAHDIFGIYPAMMNRYSDKGIGTITITNKLKSDLQNIRVTMNNREFLKNQEEQSEIIPLITAGASKAIPIKTVLSENAFKNNEDRADTFNININCKIQGLEEEINLNKSIIIPIFKKNAINWGNTKNIGSFITLNDKTIEDYVRNVIVASEKIELPKILLPNVKKAIAIYYALCGHNLMYVSDPNGIVSTDKRKAIMDKVQFPREFLMSKTGDCDDFTVLFASLLENIGIKTAIITVPGHILMAFDSGAKAFNKTILLSGLNNVITTPDGITWLIIETTMISNKKSFIEAMNSGYTTYVQKRNNAEFIYSADCMKDYPPASIQDIEKQLDVKIHPNYGSEIKYLNKLESDYAKKLYIKNPLVSARIFSELGNSQLAMKIYNKFLKSSNKGLKLNVLLGIGNLLMKSQNYDKALIYFKSALNIDKSNLEAIYSICIIYQIIQNKVELPKYIKLLPDDYQNDFVY